MTIAIWLAGAFLVFAFAMHVASVALAAYRAHQANRPPVPTRTPPVTVLRPVCGMDYAVEATLRSTFRLDWPDYEIIFCCASATDPVVPFVERLIAEYPQVSARLLTGDDRISINPKLNNLVKGWRAALHEWIVMADSNVLLPTHYLKSLFACWTPGTGLVCSPPVGGSPEGVAAEIECAFLNTYQARWQIAADTVGLGFAQGKTMLWHRDLLDQAGGIRALASEPAEDAASTKIVREAGLKVRLTPAPFVQPLGPRDFRSVWDRQVRWARLRRVSFKLYFFPELISGGFCPMLAAAFLAANDVISLTGFLAIAVIWYGAEAFLAWYAGWHRSSWATPARILRDVLIPPLWIAAWAGNSFTWRGNAMRIGDEVAIDGPAGFVGETDDTLPGGQASYARVFATALARRWRARRSRSQS
jgi:ceramide glucosyltransferase